MYKGQPASSGFFTPDDLRSSTFSPFGEPPNKLNDHSQQFPGIDLLPSYKIHDVKCFL